MRLKLNGLTGALTGALLALGFVVLWAAADYITGDLYHGPGRFLLFSGCMIVINALWGFGLGTLYQRAKRLSVTDPLTQVYNRNFLIPEAEKQLALAERQGYAVSLVVVDLDDFKSVNDTRGHLAGDEVLRQVADCFRRNLRRTDTVCRYGGDEFVLLLPYTTKTEACQLLLRIRQETACRQVPMSLGVAAYPEDGSTVDALFRRADEAMYTAKGCGRAEARDGSLPLGEGFVAAGLIRQRQLLP
ncbi:MAG TPA: GGDEF domain-containing protein [Clostridia bacterium]|nr:GGDEF domain-containing protein [Clostridia bacterium]